jgi:hypothetical protein
VIDGLVIKNRPNSSPIQKVANLTFFADSQFFKKIDFLLFVQKSAKFALRY